MGYGLDFGFDEILYHTELQNSHLISTFKARPKAPIIADSAEPKSISELQGAGLNVIPCVKGADSVEFGIKHVQGPPISYTRSSNNVHDEYEKYTWR
jgi:phage terminase large subunit